MIGLDTNILVRFLVGDDPGQSRTAERLIKSRCTVEAPGWINRIVLCELVWVLEGAYGYARAMIAEVVQHLLQTAELEFDDVEMIWQALRAYRDRGSDFADAMIVRGNLDAGCENTYTFDKRMSRLPGTQFLKA
jgi:predicted nucleic-acid-binding protein